MRSLIKVLLPLLLIFLYSCNSVQETEKPVYRDIKDLYGKKVATTTGSSQESMLASEHPQIEILRFDTDADLLNALLTRKCEALAFDHHIFAYFNQVMEGIVAMEGKLFSVGLGFCFGKDYNVELREQFNAFLKQLKEEWMLLVMHHWLLNGQTLL